MSLCHSIHNLQRCAKLQCANNLALNSSKTKVLLIEVRKTSAHLHPLYITDDCVERVPVLRFQCTHIGEDVFCTSKPTAGVKRHSCASTSWGSSGKRKTCRKSLQCSATSVSSWACWRTSALPGTPSAQWTVETLRGSSVLTQKIIGSPLSSFGRLFQSELLEQSRQRDPSHTSSVWLLPSGRHFRSIISWTNRLKNSFYPRAGATLPNTDINSLGPTWLSAFIYNFVKKTASSWEGFTVISKSLVTHQSTVSQTVYGGSWLSSVDNLAQLRWPQRHNAGWSVRQQLKAEQNLWSWFTLLMSRRTNDH